MCHSPDKGSNHPLSNEAIFPTTGHLTVTMPFTACNHPLSNEAIFPTSRAVRRRWHPRHVTILCQTRLFFPPTSAAQTHPSPGCNHPLSNEAIFPTAEGLVAMMERWGYEVTILCQTRLFFPLTGSAAVTTATVVVTILCQTRLFFPPRALFMRRSRPSRVTILCQTRLFFPPLLRCLRK